MRGSRRVSVLHTENTDDAHNSIKISSTLLETGVEVRREEEGGTGTRQKVGKRTEMARTRDGRLFVSFFRDTAAAAAVVVVVVVVDVVLKNLPHM